MKLKYVVNYLLNYERQFYLFNYKQISTINKRVNGPYNF